MTTQELKQYIDKVLGNNLRCLLPSYWWKRLFSLILDKVDEKLDAANIKTINGESILGEGNIVIEGGKGGTSVEEIYIGEEEPTDENVKVWINPNEQGASAGNGGSEFGVPNILFYYAIGILSDERKEHNAKAFQQYFALLGKAQVLAMDDVLNTVAPGFGVLMDETSMLLGVLDIQLPESGNRTNLEGVFYLLTSDGEVAPLDWDSV